MQISRINCRFCFFVVFFPLLCLFCSLFWGYLCYCCVSFWTFCGCSVLLPVCVNVVALVPILDILDSCSVILQPFWLLSLCGYLFVTVVLCLFWVMLLWILSFYGCVEILVFCFSFVKFWTVFLSLCCHFVVVFVSSCGCPQSYM